MKHIVTIGGGSGSFVVLRGLRKLPVDITAVVNMFDSGGSSGVLRDEFGVLPPGDVRRALVALSSGERASIMRDLFNYRFNGGTGLKDHNMGNLLLVALSSLYGGDATAIEKAGELLGISGKVLPVTIESAHVHAVLENGQEIIGETNIDIPKHDGNVRISRVFLNPLPTMYSPVARAIAEADLIIICPGDLYSSLIPTLLTEGISHALQRVQAPVVWIANAMTKWGETNNFTVSDFARELTQAAGISHFDSIIWNSESIPEEVREQYARERQYPVQLDEAEFDKHVRAIIKADILSHADLVRFDSDKLAGVIKKNFL